MANYHPDEDWLAAYASGAADEQTEVLIASHLTFCPQCREAVAHHEAIAGALLESAAGDAGHSDADYLNALKSAENAVPVRLNGAGDEAIDFGVAPRPLANYISGKTGARNLDSLNWTFYGPGIKRAILVGNKDCALVRLMKAQPGAKFPDHDHGSDEITLVLSGAYRDHTGRYATGDVQCASAEISHQPIVDDGEVCYAFVVSEKPAIPKSMTARIIQRFIGR